MREFLLRVGLSLPLLASVPVGGAAATLPAHPAKTNADGTTDVQAVAPSAETPATTRSTTAESEKQVLFLTTGQSVPYRIPAIARAHNNDLIVMGDYRPCKADIGYGEIDVYMRRSEDNGATWSRSVKVLDGTGVRGAKDCGFGDIAIVADATSDRVLAMAVAGDVVYTGSSRTNSNHAVRFYSEDNGKTWSKPEYITDDIYGLFDSRIYGPVDGLFAASGRICQSKFIKTGDYYRLYTALLTQNNGNSRGGRNYVLYSDDFGKTWNVLGDIDEPAIKNGDEAKCEELPDGRVVISSRTSGGRQFNIFTYADRKKATGTWGSQIKSSQAEGGIALAASCNGEILMVPAIRKADGQKVTLALQSTPAASDRSKVGIYYKALADKNDYDTPTLFATGWSGPYNVSTTTSAYSTMVMQADGKLAFFFEENSSNGGYDLVYLPISLEQITDSAYTLDENFDSLEARAFAAKNDIERLGEHTGCVGALTESGKAAAEAALTAYEAQPDETTLAKLETTVADGIQPFEAGRFYRLVNDNSNKFLSTTSLNITLKNREDKTDIGQLWSFETTDGGNSQLAHANTESCVSYLSGSGSSVRMSKTESNDGQYVWIGGAGNGVIKCVNPSNKENTYLTLSGTKITGGEAWADASKWRLVVVKDVEIDMAAGEYTSAYLPCDAGLPDGLKAYAIEAISSNDAEKAEVYLTEINATVPAKTPVILKTDTDGDMNFSLSVSRNNEPYAKTNLLQGTLTRTAMSNIGNFYQPAAEGMKLSTVNYVAANKAYLVQPENATAETYAYVIGVPSAIEKIEQDKGTAKAYDLSGRTADGNSRGIRIIDGRKVLNR